MITLWNTKSLADRLKRNEVMEWEKVLAFFLVLVAFDVDARFSGERTLWEWLIVFALRLGALLFIFTKDRAWHGKHFVERYVCLCIPVAIKVLVLQVFAVELIAVSTKIATQGNPNALQIGSTLVETAKIVAIFLGMAVYYWRMYYWMKYTSEAADEKA